MLHKVYVHYFEKDDEQTGIFLYCSCGEYSRSLKNGVELDELIEIRKKHVNYYHSKKLSNDVDTQYIHAIIDTLKRRVSELSSERPR